MKFYDSYDFQQLHAKLVSKLLSFGLSETQVMGCEQYLQALARSNVKVEQDALKNRLDRIAIADQSEIMQERSFFQRKYQTHGPLAMTEAGRLAATDSERALQQQRETEAVKRQRMEADRLRREQKEAADKERAKLAKQRNKASLKNLRDLPADFTIDDL